jgi:hypothetical protein
MLQAGKADRITIWPIKTFFEQVGQRMFGERWDGREIELVGEEENSVNDKIRLARLNRFEAVVGEIAGSMAARGMTVREIQGHLTELYGIDVSPDLISQVTDAVLEEVREWQNRPLDPCLSDRFFRCLAGENPG